MNRKRAAQRQQATCKSMIRILKLSENQIFSTSSLFYDCYRSATRFLLISLFLSDSARTVRIIVLLYKIYLFRRIKT